MAKEIQATTPTLRYLLATGDGTEGGVSYLGYWASYEMKRRRSSVISKRSPPNSGSGWREYLAYTKVVPFKTRSGPL
jgi:hypothetical protein